MNHSFFLPNRSFFFRSQQMSDLLKFCLTKIVFFGTQIAQVAHHKWANCSGCSPKMSEWANCLFFWVNHSFAHYSPFFHKKNYQFAQKTNERIPNPVFNMAQDPRKCLLFPKIPPKIIKKLKHFWSLSQGKCLLWFL